MDNETLLSELLRKSVYLANIQVIAYATGRKKDWDEYNKKKSKLQKEIDALRIEILGRMGVN